MTNVVFSGIRDKEKEQEFIDNGYYISDSVNSKTKLLIVKQLPNSSSKTKKALSLGIKIVALNEL